jgi:UDP-glucose 4-epimerase
VFGTAYDTRDGTCERDYVHVQDLAEAHLAALDWLDHNPGCHVFNLGSGQGHTVHEVVLAFAEALGRPFDVVSAPARPGDLPRYFADVSRARAAFGWTARRSLPQMAQDALRWRQSHPLGYAIIEPLKVREQQE